MAKANFTTNFSLNVSKIPNRGAGGTDLEHLLERPSKTN